MGLGDFWLQFNNGKKENLSDIKGDIRRETVDKKYQKIFDFFDTNKNGAIEAKEAEKFIEVISKFAGQDKTLTKTEAASIFSELGIKASDGIDFVGFAKELSEANKKIKTSDESILPDGSRKVVTNYTNGARFTAVYYPDGELKYTIKEIPAKSTAVPASVSHIVEAGPIIKQDPSVNPTLRAVRKVEFSQRAKAELRQGFGEYYEETAKNIISIIEQLFGDMTVWDRAGIDMRQAFINGDLTDMFTSEGVKKLEELLAKAKDDKELGQKLVEMAQNQIGTFEFHLEKDFGIKDFDFEKMENFHQTSTKYLNAKSLMQRAELLNKGLKEVKRLYQNALTKKKGVPNSDKLNSDYDKKFMEVLTEYFNGDEGVAAAFFNTMKEGLATGTKDENEENNVLITILERIQHATHQTLNDTLQGEKFENLESRYKAEFRDMYGREDDTTEVENIIQTGQEIGGTIKIGAMTTIQILLSALTMGTGNAALIATVSNPFVSYLTTVGTDYALSVAGALSSVNGLTAEKHGQILEGTVETAKFIGVGSLSAPLCRFVGNTMAKYTGKIFESGVKTTTGNITATVVTGESFLQKICSKSADFTGSFGTELGVFTGYEVVTQDEDFDAAASSQTTMLSQLKVINKFLQTALGKFVQTQSVKGQQKLAEQQYQKLLKDSGLDKAKITQHETPTGTRFTGEINGVKFTAASEAEIQAKLLYLAAQGVNKGVNKVVNKGAKEGGNSEVKTEVKVTQGTSQSETYREITYDKAVATINEEIQKTSNVSDLMPFLKVIQEKYPRDFKIDDYGHLSFYDGVSGIFYSLSFDGQGNIIKFSKKMYKPGYDYKKDEQFYVYDKSGKQTEVSRDDYHKTQSGIRTSELRNYIITNPDLLPKETRELLLQDENHYYTKEDIDELSSMLKTPDDAAIVNKLLDTRGNENRAIRAIGDALNLSQQKFGVRDIIKVLKSEDARAYVLDKIAQNKYVKKTELEPRLNGESFSALVEHKFADEVNTSYKTKDITLDKAGDVINEYQTNPQIREQINQQVPDGEAACINGKMYCRADNTLVPIKLDKATFDRLFPVEERYNIQQGDIGDCYFIAELGGYATTPNGRAALYSSFRQEGNDIIIKFPRFDNIEIKFENGDLNKLYPVSLYKRYGQWKIGSGDAHVNACDGIKMIEQAYSFVRNNSTDENVQIVANDKFLMNKQMQELDGSRLGGGAGEVPSLFGNSECLTAYTSLGFVLDGARTVEEGLEVLAKELETNQNVFGSVSFSEEVPIDVNDGLLRNHQYRIVGYDKNTQIVKMVNPHDSSKYMEIPLDLFKAAEPGFSVFKINPPKIEGVKVEGVKPESAKQTEKNAAKVENIKTDAKQKFMTPEERAVRISKLDNAKISSDDAKEIDALIFEFDNISKSNSNERLKQTQNIQNKINTLKMTNPEEANKLQQILDVKVKNPKASDVSDEMIALAAEHLIRQYDVVEADITQFIKEMGFENFGHYESRVKSDTSLFDKISNYLKDHPDETFADAVNDVRDCYGGRFVLSIDNMMKEPEVVELVNQGKIGEARQLASKKMKDELVKLFQTQTAKNPGMFYRVSNYQTKEGNGLFDEAHLFAMRQAGLDCVLLSTDEEVISHAKKKSTKSQRSGYCAFQVNLMINGRSVELQFKTDEVDKISNAEHWIYDMVTGKDIVGRAEKLEEFVSPLRKLILDTMPKEVYEEYYAKYTSAWYNWAELKAEGKETPPEPKLQDFAPEGTIFDHRLSMKNLILFDEIAGKIKRKEISPEEGIKEYNERLSYDDAVP